MYHSVAYDNGQSGQNRTGVYIKHSSWNTFDGMTLTNDDAHVVGGSGNNLLNDFTLTGGRVKLAAVESQVPTANSIQYACVHYDSNTSRPQSAFYFDGVTNGNGNDIWHGSAYDTPNSVTALNGSTGNYVVSLYRSPSSMTTDIRDSSSFVGGVSYSSSAYPCY